ncbi:MAG: 1-acyl-sn-glycerol-3-phosphate acyltransferase [Deltaproteobacteria bacterium]|nr:1-acyl-sn-glycerol-3-phosphate acyltransferase [Deltaproteobacteria bacterium]
MSILSAIKLWLNETQEYYAESLYGKHSFSLYRFVDKAFSRVQLADEDVACIRSLAEQGVVVYALKYRSRLDSLIVWETASQKGIPRPVYSHGVNLMFWQPFTKALCVVFFTLFYLIFKQTILSPYKSKYLKRMTQDRQSAIIHLGGSEYFEDPKVPDALAQLIEAQKILAAPIYLVPVFVAYSRRREKERENLIDILFSQTEDVGPLRRLVTYLRYSLAGKTNLIIAEPINLSGFMQANIHLSDDQLVQDIRRDLLDRIDEEKTAIVGPYLKSRDEMISMVLNDKDLVEFMEELEVQGKRDYDALAKEAKKYLKEIASDYKEMLINIWYIVLTWLWNNIYDGVILDREGMANIRNISKRMPFIIIPCHRSHIDYLLLSYVFYKNNIQLPFIWAGDNLSHFLIGYIFRKSGAFFVRRSFKGNVLYSKVLAKYVKMLLQEGLPLEFFIEGGRSRTGKMVMPKYGVLSMIIQAYQDKACDNLAAIPVFIGYDKVIEEKSYLRELGGEQKVTESASDVIKSRKLLRRRYGHVYVNVGRPIFLKEYLEAQENPLESMSVEERQSLYRKMGYEIVHEISKASVVTPYALISAGLLSHDRRGIAHNDLMEILSQFHDYLTLRKAKIAETLSDNREKAVKDALALLDQDKLISRMGSEEEDEDDDVEQTVYSLEYDKRLNLEYYKNGILHFFLPICFVAQSILAFREDMIPYARIAEDYRFFKKMFWNEFIFDIDRSDDDDIDDVLLYLGGRDMIYGYEGNTEALIEVRGKGRTNLMPFAGLISNYIESYWVVMRGCNYLRKSPLPQKDLLKKLNNLGARMFKKGEIRRAEAMSQANYQNALLFLEESGVILEYESDKKSDRRDGTTYCLNEDKTVFEHIRRRLFQFM